MSSSGKAGSGRGNNRKRPFKRRNNEAWHEGDFRGKNPESRTLNEPKGRNLQNSSQSQAPVKGNNSSHKRGAENVRGDRTSYHERPKWIPPKISAEPLPVSDCPWCGKPIRDIFSAISDKDTGCPVHFDCVTARIAFAERLEKGDYVAYIGGGRFGIISLGGSGSYPSPPGALQGVLPPDFQAETGQMQTNGRAPFPAGRNFNIKKIIEWENKDKRAEWRSAICDHYSVT